jgi:hypothetical protein
VARMFVTAVLKCFVASRPHGNFASLLPQLGVPYFLCRGSVISRYVVEKVVTRVNRKSVQDMMTLRMRQSVASLLKMTYEPWVCSIKRLSCLNMEG